MSMEVASGIIHKKKPKRRERYVGLGRATRDENKSEVRSAKGPVE